MAKLKKDYLVTKQNKVNEMRTYDMTLQELRLLNVYLSRINPLDTSTRVVRFTLRDFMAVMEAGRPNIAYFREVAKSLLKKTLEVPTESGGFTMFHLFRVFTLDKDEYGDWYIEINTEDEALPLLFDYKDRFFSYELRNSLVLNSKNQLRMYEALKQYEYVGRRIMTLDEIKVALGIDKNDYPEYKILRRDVLEVCRIALDEHTDISFTYKVYKRKGRGGKVQSLEFTISQNKNYTHRLEAVDFVKLHPFYAIEGTDMSVSYNPNTEDPDENDLYEGRISFLMEACEEEFNRTQMIVLYGVMQEVVPHIHLNDIKSYNYLLQKYRELQLNSEKTQIKHRFEYFKKLVSLGEG